jgi:integrase
MTRREYGAGSIHRAHAADCSERDRDAQCGCPWRGTLEAGRTERGTRRRIAVQGKTEAEVRRRLRDRRAEIKRAQGSATRPDAARKTVASWADDWLTIRERQVRPATWISDRTMTRRYIVPTIGRTRLAELTPKHVRDVDAASRKVTTKSSGAATAQKAHRVLMKMLRDANAEGYAVPANVLALKPSGQTKGKYRPQRDAMSTAEAVAVLSHAADVPNGVRWFVGLYEGMRQGERLGLTWECVDLERGLLDVSWQLQPLPYRIAHDTTSGFRLPDDYEARHVTGRFHLVRPKTAGGERVIPMADQVRDALALWRQEQPENPHGLVWVRPNGWPIDKADDAQEWRDLQDAAGVRHPSGRYYVGHEMRNTTATLLAEAGVEPTVITAIIGHSSYATTQGYIAARADAMRAAIRNVEQAFTTPALEG